MPPHGTVTDTAVRHARDQTVHQDWETQPQVNAPREVGIPTPEGQADAARIAAGQGTVEKTKEKARDVKEDVGRKI
jgi:hypothetical protein